MLQRKLSSVLIAKYAYITGGSKHPAKTMSLASNEHIDNQCCNTWCNYCSAAVVVAAATAVPGGSSSFSVLWGTAVEGRVTDLVRGGSRDWPSLAALTTEPTTTYDRRHGQCSLQSPNNGLESQIFSLTGRTFLFNLLFLVIQSIHFTTSPCVLLLEGGGGFVVVADASR